MSTINFRRAVLATVSIALTAPLLACGSGQESPSPSEALKGIAAGKGGPETSKCTLITAHEVEAIVHMKVRPFMTGMHVNGCDWETPDNPDGIVTVAVASGNYWEKPSLAPGYRALTGIGREAYVINELGGWKAGSWLQGNKVVVVQVALPGQTEAMAIELLKAVIRRVGAP